MSSQRATDNHHQVSEAPLRRVLGFRDLVLLIIGAVIGSGIFLVPGAVLRSAGNSLNRALIVWIIGGILSLLGALTYGELSAMKPQSGGLYVYIRDCFGSFPAFLFGWTLFLMISTGSVATLAVAFSTYLNEIISLAPWAAKLVSVLMISSIVLINIRGTRESADVQNLTTGIKLAAVLIMAAALLWFGKASHAAPQSPLGMHSPGFSLSGMAAALISVLWAYEGWQYCTYSAGETLNPKRNFPLAFMAGIGILIATYTLANLGYVAALGSNGVANSNRVAAIALATAISPALAKLVAFAILISIFSAANANILTAPRVYYAMAKDGLFFHTLAKVHPRFGTPAVAILATAIWSCVLALTGTFEQLLTYVVFVGWSFYALAAASIFIYRKRQTVAFHCYRVPLYPWTPLLFILVVAAFVANTIVSQPLRAAIGLAIVATGIPAYAIWRKRAPAVTPAVLSESHE